MWQLLLPPEKFPHIESFLEFLEEKTPVKVINKDQWKSFLEFSNSVAEDLKGYDESSACKRSLKKEDVYVAQSRAK